MLRAEWYVKDETLGSDHLGILIRINVSKGNMENNTTKNKHLWKIKDVNWIIYEEETDCTN